MEIAVLRNGGDWRWVTDGEVRRAVLLGSEGGASEIAVLLGDDAMLRDLNRRFRGRDAATDILSFPDQENMNGPVRLGDIALSEQSVLRGARSRNKTPRAHLAHLLVHGVLHLRGFTHEAPAQAAEMEAMERRLLAEISVPDPYETEEHPAGESAPA